MTKKSIGNYIEDLPKFIKSENKNLLEISKYGGDVECNTHKFYKKYIKLKLLNYKINFDFL